MKNAEKVEVSVRIIIPNATLINGCTIVHSNLPWQKGGKVIC